MNRRFSIMLVVLALFLSLPVSAFAKGPVKKQVTYVALGDSLVAGINPLGEDGLGYPDYLASRFEQSQYKVNFTNEGVKGANTELLKVLLTDTSVQASVQKADLITVTIGANDVLPVLMTKPAEVPQAIQTVGVNLNLILKTIDDLNPKAEVYVMGYYNPFPHYSEAQLASILPLLDALNNTIAAAVGLNGDTYVPTAHLIAKHTDTYLPNPANIHLSADGYQIVAKEFWKSIKRN
ncbi:GDSL-type esterase/lipase family protein [Bacillus sp. FJAT-27251]|uniref:GDSL-type esterase/lipase family protein n=1 Tax=Bacillus sp. FJAT-27251 TaxID=1684142 RepID=UPI0006A7CDC9|nr:GDSL-type esterase/lipase family protein [Bacillus sp. FJAT-27251]